MIWQGMFLNGVGIGMQYPTWAEQIHEVQSLAQHAYVVAALGIC
jgi:hypothetical protein